MFTVLQDGSTISPMRRGNVQLSDKHSVALTDVTLLSQESLVPIKFKGEDKTQHLRVISIQDVTGASLLFLANNFREAELLVCGLKLLLERESARLGVRGGLPIAALGGRSKEGGMSPTAARGFREGPTPMYESQTLHLQGHQSHLLSATERDDKSALLEIESVNNSGMKSCKLGKQPGRDYMRGQADFNGRAEPDEHKESGQKHLQYVHDQSISRSIAKNVKLPLPLPLCRVLLLDSTSPVVKRWHRDRGDRNFDQSSWMFPTTAPRELERHSSEHQLIASGSMHGARRTMSFDRLRNGSLLRMSEEYSVDNDDSKKVSITITEKNPRRGFSVKVRIVLRACSDGTCDAFVVGEVTPVVKDVTNQGGVHKAFHLVMDEIKSRYTTEDGGLLSGFLSVVDEMSASYEPSTDSLQPESVSRSSRQADPHTEEKKTDHQSSISLTNKANNSNQTGFVSFEDMLKTGRESPDMPANQRSDAPSLGKHRAPESYPSKLVPVPIASSLHSSTKKTLPLSDSGEFVAADKKAPPAKLDVPNNNESVLIEVKPLPKIRLSLLPSPREEDEEDNSSSVPSSKPVKKKKKKSKSSAKRIGAERD